MNGLLDVAAGHRLDQGVEAVGSVEDEEEADEGDEDGMGQEREQAEHLGGQGLQALEGGADDRVERVLGDLRRKRKFAGELDLLGGDELLELLAVGRGVRGEVFDLLDDDGLDPRVSQEAEAQRQKIAGHDEMGAAQALGLEIGDERVEVGAVQADAGDDEGAQRREGAALFRHRDGRRPGRRRPGAGAPRAGGRDDP